MQTLAATTDLLQLFAEPSRVRLAALLAEHELTVNDLTSITQLGQSRVSTHLGKLREAGVLCDRRAGGSTYYRLNNGQMPAAARQVWTLIAGDLRDQLVEVDRQRCAALLAARQKTARWPDTVAGEMERHYSPGRTWESLGRGLLGLLRLGDTLDAGAGDGATAQLIAPHARSVTCLDQSETLIQAARTRLAGFSNVRFQIGDLHDLPFPDRSFDDVLLFNVLTALATPARALGESARVLRPGGRLALVTLAQHAHQDVTSAYAHRHAGFAPATLRKMLKKAHLDVEQCEITVRERRAPYFQVVTALGRRSK
jgi:ArsR family transcriptional regulator